MSFTNPPWIYSGAGFCLRAKQTNTNSKLIIVNIFIAIILLMSCRSETNSLEYKCDLDFKYGVIKWKELPKIVNLSSTGELNNTRFLDNSQVKSTIEMLNQANPEDYVIDLVTSEHEVTKYGNLYIVSHCSRRAFEGNCINYIGNWEGAKDMHLYSHPYHTSKVVPKFRTFAVEGLQAGVIHESRSLSINGEAGNVPGKFILDKSNSIKNVVCFVYDGLTDDNYGTMVSECLTRSLGLYEVSHVIKGGMNAIKRTEDFVPINDIGSKYLKSCLSSSKTLMLDS